MNKQKFLLQMLAGIFTFQACLFGVGFIIALKQKA